MWLRAGGGPRLDNVTVVSHSHGTVSITGNTIRVDGFKLAAGEVFEMVFTAVISDRAAPGDVISNMATLESPDASVHLSNTVRTTIVGLLPDTGFGPERAIPIWLLPVLVGAIVAVCAGFVLSWKRRETQAG